MMFIPKTVKSQTRKLNKEERRTITEVMEDTLRIKRIFQEQFCGINSMILVQSFQKVRELVRAGQEKAFQGKTISDRFGIPERFWVRALKDACKEINSIWSNLGNRLCTRVRENNNLTDSQKKYCYYVFHARPIWQDILQRKDVSVIKTRNFQKLYKALSAKERKRVHNLICRLTRKEKPKKPCSKELRCISFDDSMYSIKDSKDSEFPILSIMTCKKMNRLEVPLISPWTYKRKGDIQVIWDPDKKVIRIHKLIQAKCRKKSKHIKKIGIDKGLATLLSCSSGKEYGEGFSPMVKEEAERLDKRNTNRNPYIQKKKDLNIELEKLQKDTSLDPGVKKFRMECIKREIKHLEKHNLGNIQYDREHHRATEKLESFINHSIRECIKEEDPSLIVKEDLSFVSGNSKKYTSKYQRMLSLWTKGTLDERLEYLCSYFDIHTKDVNPAYTSQFCPECGAHTTRKGSHNEVMVCPNCGKLNCNTSAAKNILARLEDKEITLFTPYKEVFNILSKRYQEKGSSLQIKKPEDEA